MKWLFAAFWIACPASVFSQEVSSKGRFSANAGRGCDPFTVQITKLDTFGAVTRTYIYEEGASSTEDTTYTYSQTGTYQIVQIVGVDDIADKTDTLEVQVVRSQRPEIQVTRCNNLQISVQSQDTYYDSVRVYFDAGDSATLATGQSATYVYSDQSSKIVTTQGLFDNAPPTCERYFEEISPLSTVPPPLIIDAAIKESCANSYTLYLKLENIVPQIQYQISIWQSSETMLYNDFLDTTHLILGNIPFGIDDFCISIYARDICSGMNGPADRFCGTPSPLSLSPFESLYASYQENSIRIHLDTVSSGSFNISRGFEGDLFESRRSVIQTFDDPIGSPTRKYFYSIDYLDSCGSVLYSNPTHPPFLNAEALSPNEYQITFEPGLNAITAPSSLTYHIGDTSVVLSDDSFTVYLKPENGTDYQFLYVTQEHRSGELLRTNSVRLKYEFNVHVPKAFTPNRDGLNDRLLFFGLPVENTHLKIYSKWGQLLHETDRAYDGWDGIVNGKIAPEGNYLYELNYTTATGDILTQRGTFALIIK